jgi:NitT/TauT family transport system substrate-binding protein
MRAVAGATLVVNFASIADAQTKIQAGYTASGESGTAYVAVDEGFLAKRGLDVTLALIGVNSTIPQAMYANSLQTGILTPSVFLQAVDGGLDLVVIAGSSMTTPEAMKNFGVVARTGAGIQAPRDFVGKKVGVPGFGAFLHVLFRQWLMENNVDTKAVTYVEVGFPNMNDVLKGGTVDAVVSAEPIMARIIGAGNGYLVPYTIPANQLVSVWTATREWATKNPAAVKAFREGLAEAIAFTKKDAAKTHEYIAKYTKLPADVVKTMALPGYNSDVTPQQLAWWADVMNKQAMLKTKIDMSKLIHP